MFTFRAIHTYTRKYVYYRQITLVRK